MAKRIFVAICESNPVFRAGLASLLKEESFRVCAIVSEFRELDIKPRKWPDELLVLVGYHRDTVLDEEAVVRLHQAHPGAHIVLLAESISEDCLRQAEAARAHGILLRSVSQDVLVKSLELIALGGYVYSSASLGVVNRLDASPTDECQVVSAREPRLRAAKEPDGAPSSLNGHGTTSDRRVSEHAVPGQENSGIVSGYADQSASSRKERLSEREMEILNYISNGCPNKIIARKCRISDATVKVHVKSILRKIGVSNRTQAAVWAMLNIEAEAASSTTIEPVNENRMAVSSAILRTGDPVDGRSELIPRRSGTNGLC
ncbi:MAG: response regulator transcription factor [Aurantimonas endophytica]|uniref:response regulator transcription factor n=1 Tax=Aurantimonas endophytica TaxID=1522175 RepID=UPI0030037ED3